MADGTVGKQVLRKHRSLLCSTIRTERNHQLDLRIHRRLPSLVRLATNLTSLELSQLTVQIAVGNVSKYLLNGHKSTLQTLQSLFQSVQLNINNPNFLIMQGKITKVLNMKAAEILGMVEEAAGTRMFEERKDKAMKTMTKKDKKVEEIESVSLNSN
jgi:chromosome segregation ATPase